MLALALSLALLASPGPKAHGDKRPAVDDLGPIKASLARSIAKRLPKVWTPNRRLRLAAELAAAILLEARRRGLDPLALAPIAWIESDFQPRASRASDGSHGVWQSIRRHSGPREALALLAGCRVGQTNARQGPSERVSGGEPCEAPGIAARRRRPGPWTLAELRDPAISTYIGAYEIRRHVLRCVSSGHRHKRRPRACRGMTWLVRYAHLIRSMLAQKKPGLRWKAFICPAWKSTPAMPVTPARKASRAASSRMTCNPSIHSSKLRM